MSTKKVMVELKLINNDLQLPIKKVLLPGFKVKEEFSEEQLREYLVGGRVLLQDQISSGLVYLEAEIVNAWFVAEEEHARCPYIIWRDLIAWDDLPFATQISVSAEEMNIAAFDDEDETVQDNQKVNQKVKGV